MEKQGSVLTPQTARRTSLIRLLVVALVTGALPGCGGGSSGSGALNSGVDLNKNLNALSKQETAQICSAYLNYLNRISLAPESCTYSGIVNAVSVPPNPDPINECRSQEQSCLSTAQPVTTCSKIFVDSFAQCDATVKLLEECVEESSTHELEVIAPLTCEDAARLSFDDVEELDAQIDQDGPRCQELIEACN